MCESNLTQLGAHWVTIHGTMTCPTTIRVSVLPAFRTISLNGVAMLSLIPDLVCWMDGHHSAKEDDKRSMQITLDSIRFAKTSISELGYAY